MNKFDLTDPEAPWNQPLDEQEREMMDPNSWDESTAVVYPPVKHLGYRLVLEIERDDMRALSAAAEAADMPLSRYILQAALKSAKRPRKVSRGHHRTEGAA